MMRTSFTFILFALTLIAHAQKLSMDEAIDIALKNNGSVQAAQHKVHASQHLKKTSIDLPKTEVSLMYGQYNSYADNDNNISVLQTIPFTVFGTQASANKARLSAAEAELAVTENEVQYRVGQTYSELQYYIARQKLLLSQDSLYAGFARAADARYKSGESNLLEKISAEAQLNESGNQVRLIAAQVQRLQSELALLINRDVSIESLSPLSVYEEHVASDSIVYKNNPQLLLTKKQALVLQSEHRLQRAKTAPDLHVGFFSQTLIGAVNPSNGELATSQTRFTGFQIGLALPLWFTTYRARSQSAEAEYQAALSLSNYTDQLLKQKFINAQEQLSLYQQQVKYYEDTGLPNAQVMLRQASISFKGGEISYTEYLFGLKNVLSVKENYLKTVNDLNQAVIYLKYISAEK